MKINFKKPLHLSLLFSLIVFILLFVSLQSQRMGTKEDEKFVEVLISLRSIAKGEIISSDKIGWKNIPKLYLEPQVLHTKEEAVGHIALITLSSGEQIAKTKITNPSDETGLSWKLVPGSRALNIEIDDISGLSGFIRPNDFVDVLVSFSASDQGVMTETLAQRVQVLAVGKDMGPVRVNISSAHKKREWLDQSALDLLDGHKKTITLLLSPEETQKIEWAKNAGKISLALRGVEDVSIEHLSLVHRGEMK